MQEPLFGRGHGFVMCRAIVVLQLPCIGLTKVQHPFELAYRKALNLNTDLALWRGQGDIEGGCSSLCAIISSADHVADNFAWQRPQDANHAIRHRYP